MFHSLRFERLDWILFGVTCALFSIGIIVLYGIGITRTPPDFFTLTKQLIAGGIGLVLCMILALADYRSLRTQSLLWYILGALMLVGVLFVGESIRGTRGWYRLGSLTFQPVEIAKLTLIVYLAAFFARHAHARLSWRAFITSAAASAIYLLLILLQPDFGSAMIVATIWFLMAACIGLPRFAWIVIPLLVCSIGWISWNYAFEPYQRDRVLTFLQPDRDPRGTGYHAMQARIAIGSGGWMGKGIGESSQARLRFLPEASTDFAIAIVGEELGFAGMMIVLGLFCVIFWRYLQLAKSAQNDMATLLLMGGGILFLVHLFINMGMNIGLLPVTGIPLPFISAAASSLVAAFINIGLAQSIALRRPISSGEIGSDHTRVQEE